ncbi:MAG TPA: lipid-binding SYLF domain-containing protein [Terriglobales bacterium]|nr:lipid-binding SYLF domain-containing protein [Terriglobales bacterium]
MRSEIGIAKKFLAMLTVFLTLLSSSAWAAQDDHSKSDIEKRLQSASEVLQEIMGAPDKGIPEEVLKKAKCIAVIPSMVKFAIGIGGHYGKGVATCKTENGWSAPAPILLTGGSWGLQFGGQAVDLIMVVMNQKGMEKLLSSKFKIGADVAAAAGPIGRHAEAGTDWKMNTEVLTYSRARGIFAGIDLSGSVVKQDNDETRVLYGRMIPFQQILEGQVPPPRAAQAFLGTLEKYAPVTTRQGSLMQPHT